MKISLGALSKLHEEWHEADNFYIFFQLDIEFEDTKSGFELFSFEVVITPAMLQERLFPCTAPSVSRAG